MAALVDTIQTHCLTSGIQAERISFFNDHAPLPEGKRMIYWMQQAQRTIDNHALELACYLSAAMNLPLSVVFVLTPYPEARRRHYHFMLEGLQDAADALHKRHIPFLCKIGTPVDVLAEEAVSCALLVTDCGYNTIQRQWRSDVAKILPCPLIQVETDAVIPVHTASEKCEYAARTLRPKITRLLPDYLVPMPCHVPIETTNQPAVKLDINALLQTMDITDEIPVSSVFRGGQTEAMRRLHEFVLHRLPHYADKSNDPARRMSSELSSYLHFGQISPLTIALNIQQATADSTNKDAYLEELIVRRELAFNQALFNPASHEYHGIPSWAQTTLDTHRHDPRDYLYSRDEWEQAATHDPYWNAAQNQLRQEGIIHNYMRMYWGKKLIEWSASPEEAFETAVYLNNTYALDGRDPNSWTGISWCFGTHDRPWTQRPVFGTVRYMNANGLKRKFKQIQQYVDCYTPR